MPLNFQTIQQHAYRRRHWGTKKPVNVWEQFAGLPFYQQEAILQFIEKRKVRLYGRDRTTSSQNSRFVLLSVYRDNFRWRRSVEAFKRFLTLDVSGPWERYILFIVIARLESISDLGENTWDSDSQKSYSSSDSNYSSDFYPSRRRRSQDRRRRDRGRSFSRSISPSKGRAVATAAAGALLAKIFQRRRGRSRGRVRETSYSNDYAETDGYDTHVPPFSVPPPPTRQRTKTDKTRNGDDDVPNFRRVETLKEKDEEPRLPSRRATEDNRARNVPIATSPPPKRRTTTFKPYADEISEIPDRSKRAAANAPANAKTRSGTGNFSEAPEPGISRRDTTKRSARAWGLISRSRTARSRSRSRRRSRSRGRSRSGSVRLVRRRRTGRSRSTSSDRRRRSYDDSPHQRVYRGSRRSRSRRDFYDNPPAIYYENPLSRTYNRVSRPSRRSRRSHREASSGMQLLTSSPSRPIIRTFEEDGVPPTQRDKAAVAEYYLRKWTTAYESVRGGTLSRRRQPQSRPLESSRDRYRSGSRSRTIRRDSYPRDTRGLIEYGSNPLSGGNDATAGRADRYYPYSNLFPPPPQGNTFYDDQKSPDDASEKGRDSRDEGRQDYPKEGDPALGADKSSADVAQQSPKLSRFPEVGEEDEARVETGKDNDRRYTLEIPRTDQRAYAESVSDLEAGLARHGSQQMDRDSDNHPS